MTESITFVTPVAPEYRDNLDAVMKFIGDVPICPTCDGYGEYETEYGPKGCQPCSSRCIPFIGSDGKRHYLDWGETIARTPEGLVKVGPDWEKFD